MPLRLRYLAVAVVILLVEVAIARGIIRGPYVRGSVGDFLVVMLIYATIRGTLAIKPAWAAIAAFMCGVVAELLQWFHLAERLQLEPESLAHTVIGDTASLADLVMYAIGGFVSFLIDCQLLKRKRSSAQA